jgi:hypothetical protein
MRSRSRRAIPPALGLGIAIMWPLAGLRADDPPSWQFDSGPARDSETAAASNRANYIRLFGLQPAFASDPLGLDADDPPGQPAETDPGPDWLQLAVGSDNPFFDIRHRGDPGGVGYYRVNTQTKVVDSDNAIFSFGLQTVTPAGRDNGGLSTGPTVFSPGFSLFYAFTNCAAIQGYLGKNISVNSPETYRLPQSSRCTVAVQQPLGDDLLGLNNLYFFVEAMGYYRYDSTTVNSPGSHWDVLPGLHWKVADNWWLSGGVGIPVDADGVDHHFWQFTCTFKF